MKKLCEHWAIGRVAGIDRICRFPILLEYCKSTARIYWIGVGEAPEAEVEKILKEFKKFKYCPKCGAKLFEFAGKI